MTFDVIIALILRHFIEFSSFRGALQKWLEIYVNFLQQKCSSKQLVSSDMSLTMIQYKEALRLGEGG